MGAQIGFLACVFSTNNPEKQLMYRRLAPNFQNFYRNGFLQFFQKTSTKECKLLLIGLGYNQFKATWKLILSKILSFNMSTFSANPLLDFLVHLSKFDSMFNTQM